MKASECKDCGRPDPAIKPPPIRIEIDGIESFKGMLADQPELLVPPINPAALAALPAFEMFAAELGLNPKELAMDIDKVAQYAQWHKTKGLWPSENPWGQIEMGFLEA